MANRRVMVSPSATGELIALFRHQLAHCKLVPGELCLVVTDTAFNPVYADACTGAALELGADTYKVTLPFSRSLPNRSFGAAMREAQLVVYMTTHGLHYSEEMRVALESGTRALMAVQPLQAMARLKADPEVTRRSREGARLLAGAQRIRITSDAGTDLTMDKTGRPALSNYGVADEPGHLDFWGAGMVQAAELEGSLEGRLVLDVGDLVFALARYVEHPVEITFREGRAVDFKGGLDAFLLRNYLGSYRDEKALMGGHMAWGTDHRALWCAQTIQFPEPGGSAADAESYYGNVQIEIGSNNDVAFRGQNATGAHLGLCSLNCNLYLDGRLVLDRGQFVLPELR